MEKIPEQNFHEVSERRKELKKAINELGGEGVIFDKHYKKPLEDVNKEAGDFKVEDFGGLTGAKEKLKRQKAEYEQQPDKAVKEAGLQKIAASLTKKSGVKQEDKVHQHIGRLNRYENFTMP